VASLFVSHSSRDRAAAEDFSARLRAHGFAALFLDVDPAQGVPAGRSWERELYVQLRRNDAVIFLASTASVNSPWCFAEVSLARSLGKPVFTVALDGAARLPLLDDVQWVTLSEGETAFTRLWAGLRRAGLDPSDSFSWDPDRSPYPGLEPFTSEDAAVFFGRDQEIDRLLELLQPTLQRGAGRCVAVVGPSGSGKSSLVHAGLVPRLERLKDRWVLVPSMSPGQHPLRELARSLARAFAARGSPRPLGQVESRLGQGAPALTELAMELGELNGGRSSVLIVVDQAEELMTRTAVREQQTFLGLLDAALTDDSPLWVVATLRSEFLSTAPDRAGLAEVVDDSLFLEAVSRTRLPEIIERPAQRGGIEFAPGLVGQMTDEIAGGGGGGTDALPLLAYALREIYERAGSAGTVTAADYAAIGGVVGALQRRADRLLDELTRRGEAGPVMPTLMKLAAVEGESEPIRRRLPRNAFSDDELAVVDAFVDARLLTSRRLSHEEATVQVAHEALLRQWAPLRDAIEASRSSLRIRSELEHLAADWDRDGRDQAYLVRGTRLAVYDAWARVHVGDLGALEHEYVDASRALASRELEATRRSIRRLRVLAAGLAVLLVLAVTAGTLAVQKNSEAQSQARVALARQLAAQADRLVQNEPDTAILLGLESLSVARGEPSAPGPTTGLVTGLARLEHPSKLLSGHSDQVHAVAFSPDGRRLVTASWDRTLRFWDPQTGAPTGSELTGHTDAINAVAVSPDGSLIASGGWDRTVRLWDARSGKPRGRPINVKQVVRTLAFSPDGTLLATGTNDYNTWLWRVDDGRLFRGPLTGHQEEVEDVAFSPDGKQVATASWDDTARLWRVDNGEQVGEPIRGPDDVRAVAFSPDGRLLATASGKAVQLWDAQTHKRVGRDFTGHSDYVWSMAFNRTGTMLATVSVDKSARLWDVATRAQLGQPLEGHTHQVQDVAFSPDGTKVATASWDNTARVWDVRETHSISRPLLGHTSGVNGVAFSPDGQTLASAGVDGTTRLWSVSSGRASGQPLAGHEDEVNRVAFSRDGSVMATASWDGTARLWDTTTGRPRGQPLVHGNSVQDLAFSPAGRLLATASADTTARLWRVSSGNPYGPPLEGHRESVNAVAFNRDGSLLATGSDDQRIRLWDVATGKQHGAPLIGHTNLIQTVAFSPDGRLLASAGQDRTIRFWDVATGSARGPEITGHNDAIYQVAFSPDGRLLASASLDGTARLWRVDTRTAAGPPLTGHTGGLYGVAFSPDGKLLATASADGTARIWVLNFAEWNKFGCTLVGRNLSMTEWNQYAQGVPYERTCANLPPGEGAPADAPAAPS
jgi:WD40 repeat protein